MTPSVRNFSISFYMFPILIVAVIQAHKKRLVIDPIVKQRSTTSLLIGFFLLLVERNELRY
uniref:Uncharacterized protein n=1 Tax=Rhizophora mucronata TaxID=61149 RepID=A0A2P2J4K8_RHIMU